MHTHTQTHTWNTEYEYERISFNNGKTRVLPVVNGTKWRKAEQHGILSLFPQNKHPIITLAVDHRAVSLLSQVSCLVSNPSLSQFDFKNVGMATSFSRFLLWFWWSSFIFVAVMIQNVPMPWGILAWRSGTMWRGTAWSFTGTRWVHLCRKTKKKSSFLSVCIWSRVTVNLSLDVVNNTTFTVLSLPAWIVQLSIIRWYPVVAWNRWQHVRLNKM